MIKQTIKNLLATKLKPSGLLKFDTFSKPIEFGTATQFDSFTKPIEFGQKQEIKEETVFSKDMSDRANDEHDRLLRHYNKYSEVHKKRISQYSGRSKGLNNYAHGRYDGKPKDEKFEKQTIETDDLVHTHKTPHAIDVYSGVPESPHHIIKKQGGYESGKGGHIILPAYTSTSLSPRIAHGFSHPDKKANQELAKMHKDKRITSSKNPHDIMEGPGHTHMLHIHVPKGHAGAYIGHHSQYSEKEFILPRNTRLHVHHEPTITHDEATGKNSFIWHAHIVDENGKRVEDK